MNNETRPDPDELLSRITAEETDEEESRTRGKLKIFFGACAGVGKTYSMLSGAQSAIREGVDIVIGVVETHGREETVKLAEGIPVIPLREVQYRGTTLKEFDLDGALARKPQLILLDELAHTNAPGSRHPKRWQDVEELLEAGIDVYTTLNVQHLESLNDVVARATGVWVKETVPDAFFDKADEISLVDIPSEELLKRLKEGKVYIAPGAKRRAAQNFFKKSNLIALRELALRRTAERVDAQMDVYKGRAGQVWSGSDRILVCIGPDALSGKLVRVAKRAASGMRAPWIALYIENERHYRLSEEGRQAVERTLRLAERMGARTDIITATTRASDEICHYAKNHGITRIIVGKVKKPRWKEVIYGTLAENILRVCNDIDVTVVAGEEEDRKWLRISFWKSAAPLHHYIMALVPAVLLTGTLVWLREVLQPSNLMMPYLIGIVWVALRFGRGPSFLATLFSAAAFNFFFVHPFFSFKLADEQHLITFAVLLMTGFIIGTQTAKMRLSALHARRREENTSALYAMTRELTGNRGRVVLSEIAAQHISEIMDSGVSLWMPDSKGQLVRVIDEGSAGLEASDPLREESAALWAYTHRQNAGVSTETLPGASGIYLPLISSNTVVGVLGVIPQAQEQFTTEQVTLLETFASLTAVALDRAISGELVEKTLLDTEGEKLRNILLSSVSHDLRTPLASITGAASTLLLESGKITDEYRLELLRLIHEEAARLARMVTNLLDVTSLESGSVKLNKELYFIEELIGSALMRTEHKLGQRRVVTRIDPGLPLVRMDGLLIEQVFINLLENIADHTPESTNVSIEVKLIKPDLHVIIRDDGPGIRVGDEERIFDKFYTAQDRRLSIDEMVREGGMGLAICRGIIAAHGGKIWAQNDPAGGALMTFTLPVKAVEEIEMAG